MFKIFRRSAQARHMASELNIADLKNTSRETRDEIEALQADVRDLRRIAHALWTLVREQGGLSDEALVERLHELGEGESIFADDVERVPWICPECERANAPLRESCLYCGCEVTVKSPEEPPAVDPPGDAPPA